MNRLSIFFAFLMLVAVGFFGCSDPHLLLDPDSKVARKRTSNLLSLQVIGKPIQLYQAHQGSLSELLLESGLDHGDIDLPLKTNCNVQPKVIYLVSTNVPASGKELTATITTYGYSPVDLCTLVAVAIEHPEEHRNIVATDKYSHPLELCARGYLNHQTELKDGKSTTKRILSRRWCSEEFTVNARFAVTQH